MKLMAKLCLALALLVTLPVAARADQWDRYDLRDRMRMRSEIRREIREAVRRAHRDSYSYRRDALRDARRAILEAQRDARRQISARCATLTGATGAGGTGAGGTDKSGADRRVRPGGHLGPALHQLLRDRAYRLQHPIDIAARASVVDYAGAEREAAAYSLRRRETPRRQAGDARARRD